MRTDRILELADFLEGLAANRFDMCVVISGIARHRSTLSVAEHLECGSRACIAGWAVERFAPGTPVGTTQVMDRAAQLLELDAQTWRELFLPSVNRFVVEDFTTLQAADVLRNLAETGRVEWERYVP